MNYSIGVTGSAYSALRCVIALPYSRARIVDVRDIFSALSYLRRKLHSPAKATSVLNTTYYRPWPASCDLLHLVNRISFRREPWVVSFEHYLPRWDSSSKIGLRRLAGRDCKRLIAWSDFAFRRQESVLRQFPDFRDVIRAKMIVLHPPESPTISDYEQKQLPDDAITFAFVGRDFFRKGGLEMLRAFKRIHEHHCHTRLTIVSSFQFGDYASQSSEREVREAKRLCDALKGTVTVHGELPNSQVLELFSRSHVALLPTYDDTYGFSVLEAQGAGCPVVTTDVGALPETNNDSVGWVVRVPKNELGIALRKTHQEREVLSKVIEDGVFAVFEDVCNHAHLVKAKGMRALQRITRDHSPASRARRLEAIYDEAMS